MVVNIKDRTGEILTGLRAQGFNVDEVGVEIILNTVDYIRENKNTTIKEIMEIKKMVVSIVKLSLTETT